MAIEKKWPAVAPQLFSSDGSSTGLITIPDTRGFKVKAAAAIACPGKPNLQVQISRVISDTQLIVIKVGGKITDRNLDLSAYTTSAGAYIYAEEQPRAELTQQDREQAVYDQEPTVAFRQVLVDQLGRYYETSNPIPVRLTDGSLNIQTLNAELNVQLSAKDNDPVAGNVHSSIRIGDGIREVLITSSSELKVSDAGVQSALTQLDNDLVSFKNANHADLTAFQASNHTDILAVIASIASLQASNHADIVQLDTDLIAFKNANHNDLSAFQTQSHADIVQLDTDLLAFKAANHSDISALQASNHADLSALQASNHADLAQVHTDLNTVISQQTNGNQLSFDVINITSLSGAISVGSSAVEAKVGAGRLNKRKFVQVTPTNGTIFWGSANSVSVNTGTPIFKNQSVTINFTDNVPVWLVSSGTVDVRIIEGS